MLQSLFARTAGAGCQAGPIAPRHRLKDFTTYAVAEQIIDRLSDNGFPVEHVRIARTGLLRAAS